MRPPWWAESLIRLLALPHREDDALGDLAEMHSRYVDRHGVVAAHLLTALGVLDLAWELTRYRVGRRRDPAYQFGPGSHYAARAQIHRRRSMRTMMEAWGRDLIRAVRSLARVPGYTAVAVLTLGLAIGATTAIYSVVDSVLLDPLDYPNSDRLVQIRASAPGSDLPEEFGPGPEFYVQYSEEATLLEDVALWRQGQTTVRAERPDRPALRGPELLHALLDARRSTRPRIAPDGGGRTGERDDDLARDVDRVVRAGSRRDRAVLRGLGPDGPSHRCARKGDAVPR